MLLLSTQSPRLAFEMDGVHNHQDEICHLRLIVKVQHFYSLRIFKTFH